MKRFINIDSIKIRPDRIRKDYPETENQKLQSSIRAVGLLNPIVLSLDGEDYFLEAGDRRRLAVIDIYALGGRIKFEGELVPPGLIPYTLFSELTEVERLQIEVDENEGRLNFTWQERAQATARLAKLRALQAEDRMAAPPSTKDIGREVYPERHPEAAATAARKELIVARHLDDPEVAKAKTIDDAVKILKRKETAARHAALAESVGRVHTAASHTLLNEDSLTWMKAAPASHFDIILTDPPYGVGADEFGDSGGGAAGAHFYEDSVDNALLCYSTLAVEGFRITKPDAHLYAFCDIDLFTLIKSLFERAGWKVFRTPLLWVKPAAFRAPWPEYGPQRKYECILYAIKGDRKVNKLAGDVLTYPPDTNLGHQAQKPVDLYADLLSRSARPGDSILDPFAGTAPILPAGHAAKCLVTAIEQDKSAFGIAMTRLAAISAQQELSL